MTEQIVTPYGWTSPKPESVSYEFGEARYGTSVNDIPANATGEAGGEDDKHSKYVDPEGPYGAAKVKGGEPSNYGNTDGYKPEKDKKDVHDTGTIDLPLAHVVVENGTQSGRNYYLVHNTKDDKFYTVIPSFKEDQEYRSTPKPNRTDALGDAYRVLSASLPDSALAQLRDRFPEQISLPNVYD